MSDNRRRLALVSAEKEILALALELGTHEVVGVFDVNPDADTGGPPILGPDETWLQVRARFPDLEVALALDPPQLKSKLLGHYGLGNLATLVSRGAFVASSAELGRGCLIQLGAKVMPEVRLGAACKLNVDVVVHHDCIVGECCTLAPGCRLLGNVVAQDEVFIGAGATILPRVRIGSGAVVGAGAVVVEDVPPHETVVGVPAEPLVRKPKPA